MARTNQGIFKEILEKNTNYNVEYDSLLQRYGAGDDLSFFEGLAQESEDFYRDIGSFCSELDGMLNATKFESNQTREKYEGIMNDAKNMQRDIEQKFNEAIRVLQESGPLSDSEMATIEGYTIRGR